MPKRYIVFKWVVYALATLLLLLMQLCLFYHIRLWGVVPFFPPVLVGVVASYEGRSASPFFAAGFGLLCDLTTAGGVPGFCTLSFTLAALLASFMAEALFSQGFLSSAASAALCCFLTALFRVLALTAGGERALGTMCSLAAREMLVTLPLLLIVFPVCRWVHRRTTFDY